LALYFTDSDKESISALRLSKLTEVNWRTARLILTKVRIAMDHKDSFYRLSDTIELDDAFIDGKHKGKRERAEGKTPVLIAMKAVNAVNFKSAEVFVKHHLLAGQNVRTDAFRGLNIINKTQQHEPKVTPSNQVDEWLPWVHIAIGNLKAFFLETFHIVMSKYLQEYLDEFCYHFNRRFVEQQMLNRLLNLVIVHMPFKST
jgi:hypothetical protein